MHKVKYTEYSRAIIGLTSIGKDPRNVAGYDLTSYLSDFNNVKKQGLNGPIFALIALNTHNYEIVKDDNASVQTTRDMLVDYILDKEISTGGWALSGSKADPDMTAMALQALAPYKNDEKVKLNSYLYEIDKNYNNSVKWTTITKSIDDFIVETNDSIIDRTIDNKAEKLASSINIDTIIENIKNCNQEKPDKMEMLKQFGLKIEKEMIDNSNKENENKK